MRPETTGDTENGRSISVVRAFFPGNVNFAIVQAAAIPNTRLTGTAIAATSSVSSIAATASGAVIAVKYTPNPFLSACTRTKASGANRNNVKNTSATPSSA